MTSTLIFDLEHNRKRLDYYTQMKEKLGPKSNATSKWIEIYSSRVQKLERQVQRLGLRTQIGTQESKSSRSA